MGARTGRARRTPLLHAADGERLVVVASNGGSPQDPGWLHNVRARPDVRFLTRAEGWPAYRAEEATGRQRARLGELATDLSAGSSVYAARARRELPVVVLEPYRDVEASGRAPVGVVRLFQSTEEMTVMAEGASGSESTQGFGPRDEQDDLTRRGLLAGAGGVTAAGALAIALPEAAEGRAKRGARRVGSGPTDRDTLRFVGQIDQEGTVLSGYGYFTEVRALTHGDLFTTPPAKTANDPRSADPSAARFTFTSHARIESMSAVGDVLSAVARGSVRVFHQPQGGARFDDPGSFGRGSQIAHFVGDMQNNLSVDGPNQGALAMSADLVQRASPAFSFGGRRRTFGRRGSPWGMRASGRARRTEPTTPRAELWFAGTMGIVDAR